MEQNIAIRILSLTEEIEKIDKTINNLRAQNKIEEPSLRSSFFEIEREIKELLSEVEIVDGTFSQRTRQVLIKVRDGEFLLSIERKRLDRLFDEYGDDIVKYFKEKYGFSASEGEINEVIKKVDGDFNLEISYKIDPFEYLNRKREFGAIITNTPVHRIIHDYYSEIQNCFLFGQFLAAIGLCRVLIERAFKDKAASIDRSIPDNLRDLTQRTNLYQLIEKVGDEIKSETTKSSAHKLRTLSNSILHGKKENMKIDASTTLEFIRKTYGVIESLY